MAQDIDIPSSNSSIAHQMGDYDREFIELLKSRLGILIQSQQLLRLRNIIKNGCETFQLTPEMCLETLKTKDKSDPFLDFLIKEITQGGSYFFREQQQIRMLRDKILKRLIEIKASKKDKQLRIWSAGCGTGEEIYTIAILLSELLPDINDWTLQLYGTDINIESLQKAKDGVYHGWSMRSISLHLKKKYFTKEQQHYRLQENLRNMVQFSYLDLGEDIFPSLINNTHNHDLILCKNVLTFFDHHKMKQLMNNLCQCLSPQGFLLLGELDPICLDPDYMATSKLIYHPQGGLFSNDDSFSPLKPLPFGYIKKKNPRLLSMQTMVNKKEHYAKSRSVQHLVNDNDWPEVLSHVKHYGSESPVTPALLHVKALAHAHLGELTEALLSCEKGLKLEPNNYDLLLTQALILADLGQLSASETVLTKILSENPSYVSAQYELALLLLKKDTSLGIEYLTRAYKMAETFDASELVPGLRGISYGHFKKMIKHKIAMHEAV